MAASDHLSPEQFQEQPRQWDDISGRYIREGDSTQVASISSLMGYRSRNLNIDGQPTQPGTSVGEWLAGYRHSPLRDTNLDASVAEHGIREPIALHYGELREGHHRLAAAESAGQSYVPITGAR